MHELGRILNNTDFWDLSVLPKNKIEAKKSIKSFYFGEIAESCDFCDYASDYVGHVPSGIQF